MNVATLVLISNGMLGLAVAAPPVIGTVMAGGAFRLNGDTVQVNGTLTEGAVLQSGRGSSAVRLAGGARLSLSADSRGRLYSDRMILEKGETRLESGAGFHLEALGLTIRPDRGLSTGRIGLVGSTRVRVAARTGSFRVLNERGALVANVAAGSALAFEPQGFAAVTYITGTLTKRSGHFLLTDQVTRVTVEVTGQDLAAYVGHLVGVTGALKVGATPAAKASQVIVARQVRTIAAVAASERTRKAAAAAGIGGAIGAAIGVNTFAVVGGVTAAETVGELVASGALPGQSHSTLAGVLPGRPPVTLPGRRPGGPPARPATPPGRRPGRPPVTPPGLSR